MVWVAGTLLLLLLLPGRFAGATDWKWDLAAGSQANCVRFPGSASHANRCNIKCWGRRFAYADPHRTFNNAYNGVRDEQWDGSGRWGQDQDRIGDEADEMGSNLPLIPGDCGHGSNGGTPTYGDLHIGDEHGCLAVQTSGWAGSDLGVVTYMGLYCFGDMRNLQGDELYGDDDHHVAERRNTPSTSYTSFSVFSTVTCAVKGDGGVRCWGYRGGGEGNRYGPGSGYKNQDVDFVGTSGRNVTSIHVGIKNTAAIFDDGSMKVIGKGNANGCGYGDNTWRGGGSSTLGDNLPFITFGETTALSAATHYYGVYANLANGKLWCSGGYSEYSCGGSSPTIVDWGEGVVTEDVQCGARQCCALLSTKGAKCWGHNPDGVLGYGDTASRALSANLPYVDLGDWTYEVQKLAVGKEHTCILKTGNTIKCWGCALTPPLSRPCPGRSSPAARPQKPLSPPPPPPLSPRRDNR